MFFAIFGGIDPRLSLAPCAWILSAMLGAAVTTIYSAGDLSLDEFDQAVSEMDLHLVGSQAIPSPGDFVQLTLGVSALNPGVPAGTLFPAGTEALTGLTIRTNSAQNTPDFEIGGRLVVTGPLEDGEGAFIGPSAQGEAVEIVIAPPGFDGLVRAVDLRIRPDGERRVRLISMNAAGVPLADELLPVGATRAAVLVDHPDLLRIQLRVEDGYVEISDINVYTTAGPADALTSEISANQISGLVANGADASQITVTVRDSEGRLRPGGGGTDVYLSTGLGTLTTLAEGPDGTLLSSLVSTIPGIAQVTARLASPEHGAIIGTVEISFDPDPDAPRPVLTITANDTIKWEGDADPVFAVNYSGFRADDDPSMLQGELTLTRAPGQTQGIYEIVPSGLSSEIYEIAYAHGTLVIEPATAARIHNSQPMFTQDLGTRDLYFLGKQAIPSPGLGAQVVLPGAALVSGQPAGDLFPSGLMEALGITLQSNSLGASPSTPSPGGPLLVSGPISIGGQSLIGPSITQDSLDIILNPSGFQGLVRAIDFPVSTSSAAVMIRLFDSQNQLIDSKLLPAGTSHVGIMMPSGTFVRVNLHAEGGVDIGDISIHTSAGPAAVETSDFVATPVDGIVANGSDYSLLQVTVRDREGRLRDGGGVGVVLQSSHGVVSPVVMSEMGVRSARLTSTSPGSATVLARLGDSADSPIVGTSIVIFDPDPTMLPVDLTVTATHAFKWTGDPDPVFTVAFSGFKAGDGVSSLGGLLQFTREPGEQAGTFLISPSGLTSDAYTITFAAGVLSIRDPLAAYFDGSSDGSQDLFETRLAAAGLYFVGREEIPSPGIGVVESQPPALFPGQEALPYFPEGTRAELGITFQTNRLGANATTPSPGDGLTIAGPAVAGQAALLGPSNASNSLDLIIAPPDFQRLLRAVAFDVLADEGATIEVRLYDNVNTLLDTYMFTPGTSRIGIFTSRNDLVRINIHVASGFFEIGEIDLHASAGRIDPAVSSFEASPTSGLFANGADASVLTVTSRDSRGILRAGAGDTFFTSASLGTHSEWVDQGDGTYKALITSDRIGNALVDIRLNDPETGPLVGSLLIAFDRLPQAVSISQLSVTSGLIPFNGQSTLSASILSATGSSVPGVKVTITSDPDGLLTHPDERVTGAGSGEITLTLSITAVDDNVAGDASASISLRIEPKTLRVIAEEKTKAPGDPDPQFTVVYEGFIEGDDESVLGGSLSISRAPGEVIGIYPITPEGLSSASYQLVFVPGNLIIADPPITSFFASATYDNPLFEDAIIENRYYLLGREIIPSPGELNEAILETSLIAPGQAAGPLWPTGTDPRLGLTVRSNTIHAGSNGFVTGGSLLVSVPSASTGPAFIGPVNPGDALDVLIDPPGLREEVRGISFVMSSDDGAEVFITLYDRNDTLIESIKVASGTRSVGINTQDARISRLQIRASQGEIAIGEIGIHLARGPLVARDDELFFSETAIAKYHISQLLDNDIDLEGAPVSLVAVSPSSKRGGSLVLDGPWILYTPPEGMLPIGTDDTFSATVSNGTSEAVTQARIISIPAPLRIAGNLVSFTALPSGGVRLLFAGIPEMRYTLQASSDLLTWQTLEPVNADSQGRIIVEDPSAGSSSFYRFLTAP